MKRETLLSLTASALILTAPFQAKSMTLLGEAMLAHLIHVNPICHCIPPFCVNICPEGNVPVTFWFDIPLGIVTGLDALATKDQSEKSVNVQDALKKLNKELEPGCSDEREDGSDSSLSPLDNLPVAPDIVASKLDEQGDAFDYVRTAAESFLTEDEDKDCNRDCMVERQNTWLLTSLALAHGTADKLLSTSRDMKEEYQALLSDFNSQTGPKGFWGSSAKITLHSHVQQNDINALYARDLEINALNGVRESNEVKK